MKLAIIGCGYISRVHLTALQKVPGATAVAVVDSDAGRANERAKEFNIPAVFTDWNQAFALPDVDAAILCLPHRLHFSCARDALSAGKHLLIEKPLCINMREARDLVALARKKKLTLMVAHMKRFDRRFTVMKEKIDEGAIGNIFLVKSEWIGPKEVFISNPWVAHKEQGGGPLMGFGSHHVDLLQWMAGPIAEVACYANHLVWPEVEVEDSAVAIVHFASGAIGSLIYTWGAEIYGQSENMSVYGTEGTLDLEDENLLLTAEKVYGDRTPHRLDTCRSDQQEIETFGKELALSSLEPFVEELRHFADCVATGKTPLVDGTVAGQAVETILRIYRSAKITSIKKGER
jgi:predicted dehydrogenase